MPAHSEVRDRQRHSAGRPGLLTVAVTVGFLLFLLADAGALGIGAVPAFFMGVGGLYLLAVAVAALTWLAEVRQEMSRMVEDNHRLVDALMGKKHAFEGHDPDQKQH